MPKEWETQLPASATAQLIHIWRGHPLPCGNRGDPRLHRWTNRSRSSSRREEGREIVERESYEAYKTYSELLDQAHKHYCGSVQMPGHLDEHWDHLNSSQSFDYWSELCLLIFVHCLCLCCGEQSLAGDELTAEQASSGLHINTSCALASHSIPRVGVLGRDTLCCLPDGTQRVLKKAWKTTCK